MKHFTSNGPNERKTFPKAVKIPLIGAFWICMWEIIYIIIGKDLILPSPLDAFAALGEMMFTSEFYTNVGATMFRVVSGIFLSFVAGVATALLAYIFTFVRDLLSFVVVLLKSTPVMAVIIFAILWLTSGNVPIFACFLMCYPVVYINILSGLDGIDRNYLEMANVFRLKAKTKIRYLYIPFVMPYVSAALSLTSGLSWKTVVTAEVLASPALSMGYNLLDAKVYLETDRFFAWIIAIVALSIIFEKLIKYLLKHIMA